MEDRLREIIISITNRCNLRCIMCQIPEAGNNEEMTTEEIKNLILDATNLNPSSIIFSGGEPLLRKDIFELITFANKYKINTCLTSNGTLIDDGIAKQLNIAGIGVVNISIEGPEDIHDSMRGKGTFTKAVEALRRLSKYKIETTIATVVCRNNYKSLAYIMELAHQFGITTVKFQPFSDIFLVNKGEKRNFFTLCDTSEEIKHSMEEAIELSKKYKIATNPLNYLYSIPEYLCGLRQNYGHNSCSALWSSCPISAEGDVHLCWVLSDKLLGNVRKEKLSRIWNSCKHNLLRRDAVRDGCPGCLMSCYDYNFGRYNLQESISLKAKKFRKPKFYKRQYYRVYQYLRYVSGKIINRTIDLALPSGQNRRKIADALEEIKIARNTLKKKLITLKKDARS